MSCPNIPAKPSEANVFLATENRLLRDTLARLLRKQAGIHVAGAVANIENIPGQILGSECDLVLADLSPEQFRGVPQPARRETTTQDNPYWNGG